jgi:hypothetical protein
MTSDNSLFDALKYRVVVTDAGSRRYYNSADQLHRDEGPAIIQFDGTEKWYQNGKLHRDAGPAIEYASGVKEWRINGQRHRDAGPAVIWANGRKEWYYKGVRYEKSDYDNIIAGLALDDL